MPGLTLLGFAAGRPGKAVCSYEPDPPDACSCCFFCSSAMACLPSGLPAELPGSFAVATVALQFRYTSTVSVTGEKSSPLIHGADCEWVTMQSSSASVSPTRLAITAFLPASLIADEASLYFWPA